MVLPLKYYISDSLRNSFTLRVYLEFDGSDTEIHKTLSRLSCWGNYDAYGARYRSWEFDGKLFTFELLHFILQRFGYVEEQDAHCLWMR